MRRGRGIALLIVLWVLTILMVTVFSFAVMTRAETYGTLVFKEDTEKRYLAEAGIERGIMEILYASINRSRTVTLEEMGFWRFDGTLYKVGMGGGSCEVRVVDETGKISLNGLTDASGIVLKNLLVLQGVGPETADEIVDAVLDWKDSDDLHRLHGAESDYYLSLPKPYRAANDSFKTLEELILVKGITPEILYGTDKTAGIFSSLTLYGKAGRVNINAAPPEVLAALPGMEPGMLNRILEIRTLSGIRSMDDIREILGAAHAQMAAYLDFGLAGASGTFSIESTGYRESRKRGYAVAATVVFGGRNMRPHEYRYVHYKSPAEIQP
jgi:general secretion pathway protein K